MRKASIAAELNMEVREVLGHLQSKTTQRERGKEREREAEERRQARRARSDARCRKDGSAAEPPTWSQMQRRPSPVAAPPNMSRSELVRASVHSAHASSVSSGCAFERWLFLPLESS